MRKRPMKRRKMRRVMRRRLMRVVKRREKWKSKTTRLKRRDAIRKRRLRKVRREMLKMLRRMRTLRYNRPAQRINQRRWGKKEESWLKWRSFSEIHGPNNTSSSSNKTFQSEEIPLLKNGLNCRSRNEVICLTFEVWKFFN